MPKTNPGRRRGPETDAALRIALERDRRGMSAAHLARLVTARGCPINASAINKIEQGKPPRRITVDELVAFAEVFDLDVTDLLIPAHAAREKQIEQVYRQLVDAHAQTLLTAAVYEKHLEQLSLLTSLDLTLAPNIARARDSAESALRDLTETIEMLSDEVRTSLRRSPPRPFVGRTARTGALEPGGGPTDPERRAALAASPPPSPPSPKQSRTRAPQRPQS